MLLDSPFCLQVEVTSVLLKSNYVCEKLSLSMNDIDAEAAFFVAVSSAELTPFGFVLLP